MSEQLAPAAAALSASQRSNNPTLRTVPSNASLRDARDPFVNPSNPFANPNPFASPYSSRAPSLEGSRVGPSLAEKFSLSPDPSHWGSDLNPNHKEPDDFLHDPEAKGGEQSGLLSSRSVANLGCLFILCVGLIGLFAGYPIVSYMTRAELRTLGAFNIGALNASGQVPEIPGNWALIDKATPPEALHKISWHDGSEWDLVFSDEFETEGRSFYPGDDPYWEAVDLHYWGTNNLEWYDPAAVTTEGGKLKITLSEKPSHNLQYEGGLISSWNKFCFTGGYIETSVSLPGRSDVYGLWPAVWTMGNLGRAGYGASLDGMWPYTYDSCDVGTLANQTLNGLPRAALTDGDPGNNNELSYLPGQRLSACTCPGEMHPGPIKPDGTYVGRSAPEIDIIEAQVDSETLLGHVSQSGQWAPFNAHYEWFNETNMIIENPDVSHLNSYKGGVFQQSTSVVSETDQNCYTEMTGCFSIYGFEYKPGYDGYITWINDGKKAWTQLGAGTAADPRVEIGPRPVPQEPMYIIANLGISRNFGPLDEENLRFPSVFLIDYIRVYQPKDAYNVGCDPPDFPTKAYIDTYIESYTNPNLTTWVDDYKQTFPKNRLIDQC